jgi:hypothetical protein
MIKAKLELDHYFGDYKGLWFPQITVHSPLVTFGIMPSNFFRNELICAFKSLGYDTYCFIPGLECSRLMSLSQVVSDIEYRKQKNIILEHLLKMSVQAPTLGMVRFLVQHPVR